MIFPHIRRLIGRARSLLSDDPAVAGEMLTAAPPPRGMVPCLDHAGRTCIHCARIHGVATGYLPEPMSAAGWTDRAHTARMMANRATSPERRRALMERAAMAWGESIRMAPPVGRANLIDQTVRDWIEAGDIDEAALTVEEFPEYASEWACAQVRDVQPDADGYGVGARVRLRRQAAEELAAKLWEQTRPFYVEVG